MPDIAAYYRQIAIHPAGAVVGSMQGAHRMPPSINIHQVFTLAEAIQEYGHRAEIDPMRAQPKQVVQDTVISSNITADVLRTAAETSMSCRLCRSRHQR